MSGNLFVIIVAAMKLHVGTCIPLVLISMSCSYEIVRLAGPVIPLAVVLQERRELLLAELFQEADKRRKV